MGYKHPDILKSAPYYDDFDDANKFLRILFKPGYAVQARELTQLQTLLQNQVAKMGSHLFKDGSQVFGGGVNLGSAEFIRANIVFASASVFPDAESLRGVVLTQGSGSTQARAKIIDIISPTSTDTYHVIVFQYLTGTRFIPGTSTSPNELTTEDASTSTRIDFGNFASGSSYVAGDLSGTCQTISVESGIFYTDGMFVSSDEQVVTLRNVRGGIKKFKDDILTTEGVTNRIGFEIVRATTTAETDSTLNDPARGFYNYNAPGADRYQIILLLVTQEYDEQTVEPGELVTPDFIELARVVTGVLDHVRKIPTYAELEETLARRTYDESGNYTVKAFELEVKNHYRDDVYSLFVRTTGTPPTFYVGDFINTLENGTTKTKIGEILSFRTYTPTAEELSTTDSTQLPTHVFTVVRVKNSADTFNYPFFIISDSVYYTTVGNESNFVLGTLTGVSADRDPDGVYSPEEGGVDDKFVLSVKPGKAYVFGHEFETINNYNIVVDKDRLESIVVADDYNLGANIGNYFIVQAPLLNWYKTLNIETLPFIKFGGKYVRISIPYQPEVTRTAQVKYWTPIYDPCTLEFRSVAFITTCDASATESIAAHTNPTEDEYLNLIDVGGENNSTSSPVDTDDGFIRPQETNRTQTRFLGGGTSSASYPLVNMSNNVETDISRMSFTDSWHGDFQTAYDMESEDTTGTTYTTETYLVKQIKCLDTTDPTKVKVTTGEALRWVPANRSGSGVPDAAGGNTLYVKTLSSVDYTGTVDDTAHFNVEDGVLFSDPNTSTSPISYGTSISYVVRESTTKRLVIRPTGSLGEGESGCSGIAECTDQGQGGIFAVGDIVTQNYKLNGIEVQAVGEVTAVNGDFTLPNSGENGIPIYVQPTGFNNFYGINDEEIGTQNITELGCIVGPCGVYRPKSSILLNSPACGEMVRIGIKDSENFGVYATDEMVFQYNYLALQETSSIPSYATSDLVKGKVVSWNAITKELLLLEQQGRFEKSNGSVYQLTSSTGDSIKYGGRGWNKTKTKHATDDNVAGIAKYDIEKVSGIFADMTGAVEKEFLEAPFAVWYTGEATCGEAIVQVAIPNIQNYTAGNELVRNELVSQIISSTGTRATGIVLSFTHRDLTNPVDISPTVVVLQPTNENSFVTGGGSGVGFLESNSSQTSFNLAGAQTAKTKEIIGCGRLRLLRRQEADAYQAFFFDIKMDFLPDLSRRYNLNEVSDFYYEEAFADSLYSNFEEDDLQLAVGTSEDDLIFTVHPTKGIDLNATTDFFAFSKVFDPDLNSAIFPLPGSISVKTVGEMDYRIQQQLTVFDEADFNTDTLNFTTGDIYLRFIGGESSVTGKVDSNDIIEHYTLIIDGVIIDLTSGAYSLTTNNYTSTTSNSELAIRKVNGDNWLSSYVQLITNLNVNPRPGTNGLPGGIRIKTLSRATDELTLRKTKSGTWKTRLNNADIFAIDKITLVSAATKDIKNQFVLFDGQTDNLYDLGQVTLKSEYLVDGEPVDVSIVVSYRYFSHGNEGPVTVDSYVDLEYRDIPYYTSPASGRVYRLDSVIDMRPVVALVDNTGVITKKWIPAPASSFDVDYSYYLSKAFKLAITRDLHFRLVHGIPASVPELPADDDNSMPIYDIVAAPYVFSRADITATMINNRRYTMKDIIQLDERIQVVEQYTVLNSLEKQAEADAVVDESSQLPRVKTAIVVDNFNSHIRGDVGNPQYNIAIDAEGNMIRPPCKMHAIELEENTTTANNIVKTADNVVMLSYDEVTLISQFSSSGVEKINPFNDVAWIGSVTLSPSSDSWFDSDVQPDIRANETGVNDVIAAVVPSATNNQNTGIGFLYGFERYGWFGKPSKRDQKRAFIYNYESAQTHGGGNQYGVYERRKQRIITNRLLKKGRLKRNNIPVIPPASQNMVAVGADKVVNKSVVPFIRSKTITASAEGLRPYTTVYVFFDDVDITSTCAIVGNSGETVSTGGLKTNQQGVLNFTFDIGTRKFKAGEKVLVITDSSSNNPSASSTIAECVYVANGAIEVSGGTYVSTRKSTKTPSSYTKNIADPVAQTFFVDQTAFPHGIFVSSVDLFFSAVDTTLPVTVELRPTTSGYPATRERTEIYPFASVTKYPTDIVVSTTQGISVDNTKTRFTFSTPVHLLPGEHSIVVKTNSSVYSLYVAEIGKELLDGTGRISQQAAIGSFFKSQNAGKWQAYENIDLMFGINRCIFGGGSGSDLTTFLSAGEVTGTISFTDIVSATNEKPIFQTYTVNNDEIKFNDTSITYSIRTTDALTLVLESSTVSITPNASMILPVSSKVLYNGASIELNMELTTNNTSISPVFDIDRMSLIGIQNIIENNTTLSKTSPVYNGELEPETPIDENETARCRYISKIIELESGFESTNIRATLSTNIPADTRIQVFAKYQSSGKDGLFDEEEYVQLLPNKPTYLSPDETSFTDIVYSLPLDLEQPFSKFAIKVCLYSANPVRVPKVKEMRVISVI